MNNKPLGVALFATFTAFTAFTAFTTSAAHAGEATCDYPAAYTSSVSRAEVRQAAIDARANDQVDHGEMSFVAEAVSPELPGAQVRAETLEAIRVGAISRGEQNFTPTEAQLQSIRPAGLRALALPIASL